MFLKSHNICSSISIGLHTNLKPKNIVLNNTAIQLAITRRTAINFEGIQIQVECFA